MMIWLRSVLFALVFYTGTTVAVLTAFLLVPFGNAAVRAQAQRYQDTAQLFLALGGNVPVEVAGR